MGTSVATSDRTVQPELQRFVAKRMGATIYEVDRIADNVYEQDMADLELNFFLNLSGHVLRPPLNSSLTQ